MEKRRSKTIKEKTIRQKFHPCEIRRHNFKSVTQKHIGRYEIFSKVTARLQQVEARRCVGKHLSICGRFIHFNSSQWLYRHDSCWEGILPSAQCRLHFNKQKNNPQVQTKHSDSVCAHVESDSDCRWNNAALHQTWNWKRPQWLSCLKTSPEPKDKTEKMIYVRFKEIKECNILGLNVKKNVARRTLQKSQIIIHPFRCWVSQMYCFFDNRRHLI